MGIYSTSQSIVIIDILGRGGPSNDDSPSHSMNEVVNEPLDPVYLKKWMTTSDIRVSKRQIEAAQVSPSHYLSPDSFSFLLSTNDIVRLVPVCLEMLLVLAIFPFLLHSRMRV